MSVNLISKKQLLAKVPLSDRHILDLEKEGKFPTRIVLSARSVAWVESEIDDWIAKRRASNAKAQRPPQYRQAAVAAGG